MATSEGFRSATAVSADGDGRWKTQLADGWDILGNTNGGYMLAIASRASSEATGGRLPVTITGHFTRRGISGPAAVETDVVRSGRQLSVVRSRLLQDDQVILEVLGTFAEPRSEMQPALLTDATPVDLPPPDACLRSIPSDTAPFPPPSVGKIDLRTSRRVAEMLETGPYGEAALEGWFRLLDDEPLDVHALILASDSFPPTAFAAGLPIGWTPTIELTVHIRDPHVQGWIKCEFRSRFVSGGFIEEDGLFWDESGALVAQSRQLAMVSKG
ncbi:MAG: thioesterase family protein [Acidimicrobiia bacterium]|nr:thioesterase family protein [Acidimicrobiia bacterium]